MKKKLECGQCGNSEHELFRNKKGIITVCTKCGSESLIYIYHEKPSIRIKNKKGLGTITTL